MSEPTPEELFEQLQELRSALLRNLREGHEDEAERIGRLAVDWADAKAEDGEQWRFARELSTILDVDTAIADAAQRNDPGDVLRGVVENLGRAGYEADWLTTAPEHQLFDTYLNQGPLALRTCPHGRQSIFGDCESPPCPDVGT
ncbi:hypothetical protein ACFQV2_16065 [Actinokineospora soli]|uniref:Uncharacterized protein n=1 Tax=Actinokineospora soli TaxID=1048753 RepID=A0ABW2TPE9_9PSEU